jgi:hypothetical protein
MGLILHVMIAAFWISIKQNNFFLGKCLILFMWRTINFNATILKWSILFLNNIFYHLAISDIVQSFTPQFTALIVALTGGMGSPNSSSSSAASSNSNGSRCGLGLPEGRWWHSRSKIISDPREWPTSEMLPLHKIHRDNWFRWVCIGTYLKSGFRFRKSWCSLFSSSPTLWIIVCNRKVLLNIAEFCLLLYVY